MNFRELFEGSAAASKPPVSLTFSKYVGVGVHADQQARIGIEGSAKMRGERLPPDDHVDDYLTAGGRSDCGLSKNEHSIPPLADEFAIVGSRIAKSSPDVRKVGGTTEEVNGHEIRGPNIPSPGQFLGKRASKHGLPRTGRAVQDDHAG
jgi:hypothetical protein